MSSYFSRYWLPLALVKQMLFLFSFSSVRRRIFMRKERYSFSCAKLRFALYIIWVLRHPLLDISNICAIMQSLSLRFCTFSKLLTLFKFVLYLLSITKEKRAHKKGVSAAHIFPQKEYANNVLVDCSSSTKNYVRLISQKRIFAVQTEMSKAIGLSRDKMKRRAFHLRSLIGNIKNKKAKQQVIEEYVSLISQMSRNN